MKKHGYAEATISGYTYVLGNPVKRGASLYDPENIKELIARQDTWSPARKNIVVKAYTLFLKIRDSNRTNRNTSLYQSCHSYLPKRR